MISTPFTSAAPVGNFRRVSPQQQELIDWKTVSGMNRIYFRSIEDTNRNGEFEKEDQLHYFYIDFDSEALEVEEYFPV